MPKQVNSSGRGAERLGIGTPFVQYPFSVQTGMIGTQILPIFPVGKKAAALSSITRAGVLRTRDVRRQDGSAFSRDTFDTDEISYSCLAYGHEQTVTKAQREVYRSDFDSDAIARAMVETILDREREKRIAAKIFDVSATGWYSSTAALYTDVTTDWDTATATIIADVEGAKDKVRTNCGIEANTLVVGAQHLKSFNLNTDILARFKVTNPTATQVLSYLPELFGIPKVLIAGAIYNSANEGQSHTGAFVWSDDYCWIGVTADDANLATPCVGRSLQWDAFGADGYEWNVYSEPQTKTDVWQAEHWVDEKIFDLYFGHVLLIDT